VPRRKSWLKRISDGFRNIWENVRPDITEPEDILEPEDYGQQPPPGIEHPGTIRHDYLPEWGPNERRLWDWYPLNNPDFMYTQRQYQRQMEKFHEAFIERGLTKDHRDRARDEYFAMTAQPKSSFDWGGFRDYVRRAGTPK
jgi:hypothetical protein